MLLLAKKLNKKRFWNMIFGPVNFGPVNFGPVNFGPVIFGQVPDRQKARHMSPPCIGTGVLKNEVRSKLYKV